MKDRFAWDAGDFIIKVKASERDRRFAWHFGDLPGHDFRGNQYVAGVGGGSQGGGRNTSDQVRLGAAATFMRARVQAFRQAGGNVEALDIYNNANRIVALRTESRSMLDAYMRSAQNVDSQTHRGLVSMVAALHGDVGIGSDVIVATDKNGHLAAAMSVRENEGHFMISNLGSARSTPGAATAIQAKLLDTAAARGFRIDSSWTPNSRSYHVAIGRQIGDGSNTQRTIGLGGSRWSQSDVRQLSAALHPASVAAAEDAMPVAFDDGSGLDDTAEAGFWTAFWAQPQTFGDQPGHDFHGNQYTGGIGGGAQSSGKVAPVSGVVGAAMASLPPEMQAHIAMVADKLRAAVANGQDTKTQFTDPLTGQYTAERQAQQQKIVNDILARNVDVPAERQAIILGGLAGAGKSSLMVSGTPGTPNADRAIVDLNGDHVTAEQLLGVKATADGATREEGARITNFANISADDVKERMVGAGMDPKISGLSPMETAALMHEESSTISKMAADQLQAQGKNVIWDVTLGSQSSGAERIGALHDEGYNVKLAYVSTTVDGSVKSAMGRYARGVEAYKQGKGLGGRYVLPDYIEAGRDGDQYRSKNEAAFFGLINSSDARSKPDSYVMIDNENYAHRVMAKG